MPLIDPSTLAAGSRFSFGQPCLSWKLVAAFKTQWGWTGFDPGIVPVNMYLTRKVDYRVIGDGGFDKTTTAVFFMDRFSGAVTSDPPGAQDIENLPGNILPVTHQGNTVQIADTGDQDGVRQIFTVTLSNPYTMEQFSTDVDALLGNFDPATVPNKTFTEIAYSAEGPGDSLFVAIQAMQAFPGGYPPLISFNENVPLQNLGDAALAGYVPIFPGFSTQPAMVKIWGFISMAGTYCLRTYAIDAGGNPVGSPTCIQGSGNCGSFFKVTPPSPFVYGQNTYVVVVPNCRCGS